MNSKTLCIIALILLGFSVLTNCGGSSGSPSVSFSASSLTFGDEEQGSTSEPLLITLTNSGTAPLTITGIVVSANFAESNNCGSTLAAGANCAINVTLAPDTTGSLKGTVTFTDNAVGSPQTVSLSGTAVRPSTLTGYCVVFTGVGPCGVESIEDTAECPVGKSAVTPAGGFCQDGGEIITDTSTHCLSQTRGRSGSCQATSAVGNCSVQGQQCGGTDSTPCCSGFTCTAGTGGSFCQPSTGESANKANSSWEQRMADRLR